MGRQPGECRGTKDAAVRHFTTQTVNSVPAHTLRRASKAALPSLPPPGASQTVPGWGEQLRETGNNPNLPGLLHFWFSAVNSASVEPNKATGKLLCVHGLLLDITH